MELDWEREEPRDNVIAGTVGAFLGSLIGVACIVLVNQLGYVSAICGAIMAVCSIKGYTMLGGVPVLISAFRDPSGRAAAREPEAVPAQEKAQTTLQAEFYSLQKNWMRPLRLSVGIPVLTMMAAVIVGWLGLASLWQINVTNPAVMGGFLSILLLFFLTLPSSRP